MCSAAVRSHQGMRIADTEREFKRLVRERGYDLTTLGPAEAVAVVLDFYRSVHCSEVEPHDGDALLYQWGVFDWGAGKHFEFDLTRQLIRNGGTEDSHINQLHVTLSFPPTPDLSALGQSNQWCWSVADSEVFESFIRESGAFKAVSSLSPSSVNVRFEEV